VIAVGAVHAVTGRLASFSSRGPTADGRIKPDVVAPGQSVYTVSGRGADDGADDAFALREYRYVPGTSFASPIVAGASALLLQQNPEWSPLQVADALRMTATDLGPAGPDTLFGWGRIDVARASGLDLQETSRSVADLPFPNPARGTSPTVHFPVQLTTAQDISVALFDGSGLLVDVIDRRLPAGVYTDPGLAPAWRVPEDLASGVYLYRIGGLSFERSGKVAILRGP
jgi:subtilisin family serine protease